jgi:CRP-like cAMP-binding protein
LLDKKTHTFIKDIDSNKFFGEISFFTVKERCVTARSKNFVEVLKLDRERFDEAIDDNEEA